MITRKIFLLCIVLVLIVLTGCGEGSSPAKTLSWSNPLPQDNQLNAVWGSSSKAMSSSAARAASC